MELNIPGSYIAGLVFVIVFLRTCDAANVNDDGNLTYEALPAGEEYFTSTFVFNYGGFPLTWAWTFIDITLKVVSPFGPPYDLINQALSGSLESDAITSQIPTFIGNFIGFVLLFLFALAFCVFFPIFILCFAICRCLGKCGGTLEQTKTPSFECKRICYTSCLFISVFWILFGGFTAFAVSAYTSEQVTGLSDTVNNNLQDLVTYTQNTVAEIEFLVDDQLSWTIDQVIYDLTNIDTLLGEPVLDELRPSVDAAIDATIDMDAYLDNTLSAMIDLNDTQEVVEELYETVDAELTNFTTVLSAKCSSCSTSGCCDGFNYTGLSLNPDYRDLTVAVPTGKFPQAAVDVAIAELQSIQARDLGAAALEGRESFESIPETLKNTTSSTVTDLETTFDTLQSSISDLVNASVQPLKGMETTLSSLYDDLEPHFQTVLTFNAIRDTIMTLIFAFVVLVGFLFFFGIFFGCFGYTCCYETPSKRKCCSNCGGCVILIACFFSALLIIPFSYLSSVLFVIMGPADRLLCDPILSRDLYAETIDKENAIVDGYYLGKTLFNDGSIPMTISSLLEGCENNRGIYTSFNLSSLFNISQFTDIDQFLGDVSEFQNISGDFTSINILSDDTQSILEDFRDSTADEIDWSFFQAELLKNVTTNYANDPDDIAVLVAAMRSAISSLSDSTDINELTNLADDLEVIDDNYFSTLVTQKNLMSDKLEVLLDYTDNLNDVVNNTIDNANVAQDVIDNSASALVQQGATAYTGQILSYPYQYATYIERTLTHQVGRCGPVYDIYDSTVNTLCIGFIQAFNGFWYCLSMCTFMYLIAFCCGIKSSKYYRRMKRSYGFNEENEQRISLKATTNKVSPEQVP